jgi:hypothetical protein
MTLKDYIKGDKRGKEANRLERDAINDPFLQEAMDGFDNVTGNHTEIIAQLEKRVTYIYNKRKKQKNWLYFGSMAASILILLGFSYYFMFVMDTNNNTPLVAENKTTAIEPAEALLEDTDMLEVQNEEKQYAPKVSAAETKEMTDCDVVQTIESLADCKAAESMAMIAEERETTISKQELQTESEKISDESLAHADNARSDYKKKEVQSVEAAAKAPKSAFSYLPFGEKEFIEYCLKNADKKVCGGKGAKVKVTFFINDAGKPTEIKYSNYSCDDAKKEMEKLLNTSPVWTGKSRKVSITLEW